MSLDADYIQITFDEYIEIFENTVLVDKFFGYLDIENKAYAQLVAEEGRFYTLGTQWQAIHFLLTGNIVDPIKKQTSLLSVAIIGKHPFPNKEWEDTLFYLTFDEVQIVASELRKITTKQLERNFEQIKHLSIIIYRTPPLEEWGEYYLHSLICSYRDLREFYIKAAENNNAMLVWIG